MSFGCAKHFYMDSFLIHTMILGGIAFTDEKTEAQVSQVT